MSHFRAYESGQNRLFVQEPNELTRSREHASGAGEPCAAICPDTSPGAPLILFKNTRAVAADDRAVQRHRAIAVVSVNCCFTVT